MRCFAIESTDADLSAAPPPHCHSLAGHREPCLVPLLHDAQLQLVDAIAAGSVAVGGVSESLLPDGLTPSEAEVLSSIAQGLRTSAGSHRSPRV